MNFFRATIIALLCTGYSAGALAQEAAPSAPEDKARKVVVIRSPAPVALGRPADPVRLYASGINRWSDKGESFIELRGGALVVQGTAYIRGARLLIRLSTSDKEGWTTILQVYGGAGAKYANGGKPVTCINPSTFHLTTTVGVCLATPVDLAGEAPPEDLFITRAKICFARKPGAELPNTLAEGLLGQLRPSAEEMVVMELPDERVVITLRGNAELSSNDFALAADTIRIHILLRRDENKAAAAQPKVERIYAEGVVDLKQTGRRITAKAIYLDMIGEEGLALEARLHSEVPDKPHLSIQFYSDVIRQLSQHRFVCESPGFFTTSRFAAPHYRFEGSRPYMVTGPGTHRWRELAEQREIAEPGTEPSFPQSVLVSSQRNIFYIGAVPVFYWPYLARDVSSDTFMLKSFEYGSTKYFGTIVTASWDVYDLGLFYNDWSDLTLLTDSYSERGVGIGFLFDYATETRHGFAKGFYIDDDAELDDLALPTPQSSRGQLTWRHREEELPFDFRADVELGLLSDRTYLRTYERLDYDEGKDHETLLYLRRSDENRLLTGLARIRINSFQTELERQGVAYHIFGEPVFDTPLLWTSHTDLSRLHVRPDDELKTINTPDAIVRFDTLNELSYPFQMGLMRWDPYLLSDLTFVSDRANDRGAKVRGAWGAGFRAAANFYRTFDVNSELLDVERLRHIITPTLDYKNLLHVSDAASDFIAHDEIDALDEMQSIAFGLHNRLQTHRYRGGKREVVDFMILDVDLATEINNPNWRGDTSSFLLTNYEWQIREYLRLTSTDNRYNFKTGELERLYGAITLDYFRPLSFSLSQTYYVDTGTAMNREHSISGLAVTYQPSYSRWRVEFAMGYDFLAERQPGDTRDPRQQASSIFFYRQLEDWELMLGAEFNQGREDETKLTIKLVPPGSVETKPSYR